MHIPYVIDNREHKLADILNELLGQFESRSMDIASAFFSIRGFQLVQEGLENIGSLRLLLGARARSGEDVGLRPGTYELPHLIGEELSRELYDEETLRLVEDLISFLRQENVQVRAYFFLVLPHGVNQFTGDFRCFDARQSQSEVTRNPGDLID